MISISLNGTFGNAAAKFHLKELDTADHVVWSCYKKQKWNVYDRRRGCNIRQYLLRLFTQGPLRNLITNTVSCYSPYNNKPF